jgi:hypothetical protein
MQYTDFHYRRIRQHNLDELVGISVGGVGTNKTAYTRASALALAIALDNNWDDAMQFVSQGVSALQADLDRRGETSACMPILKDMARHLPVCRS